MKLADLLAGIDYTVIQGTEQTEVGHITYDSRKVRERSMFVCIQGFKLDGHDYIREAARKGAAVVLIQRDIDDLPPGICAVKAADTRKLVPLLAHRFYGEPSKRLNTVAITGTNGKTSVSTIIAAILESAGRKTGVIGTIHNRIGDQVLKMEKTTYTTPEALDLHALFKRMLDEGAGDVVMEATSMALELHRLDHTDIDIGVFTNLTQDHLDDHKTMENYMNAKLKLFRMCKRGIVNADDPTAEVIRREGSCEITTYGVTNDADLKASDVSLSSEEVAFTVAAGGEAVRMKLRIPGIFSVYNALAAIAVCLELGLSLEQIACGLASVEGVEGRFQTIAASRGYSVIVDYAHTPDALDNVLSTVKGFAKGQIITVFGCGGDRDRTKRPIMGSIAGTHSDVCIITSDNPRTEDPVMIMEDIEAGLAETGCRYETIEDRKAAIHRALALAKPEDVVVIAGKGHENYQEVMGVKHHFDDSEVVRQFIGKEVASRD
ncbi:UDP-N-acetylmuramoyl-L-alanyl-D-glutamate--2,6-diaminopimelate ligase [Paenibacillus thermotolerans]|uniref:UDP-N-acetylmuramoyl-L-alanyl-D-glutamate--2, 6-diaminopimelate ligase n=1 Tax=Paenibacillus thermotolerans TaxID=3027807 RepID=UPI002367C794|nr:MULTISPECIES: UDP-N-acetylmuramoyl-L-alanyl-D-glutamate--2,6-diaminopimelate ligase [unclassified Paenibacillus]